MPNLPLLRQILKHIDAFPDQWNQEFWAQKTDCGTSCCIAGWACVLSGFEIAWEEHGWFPMGACLTTGDIIESKAAELLEITYTERGGLFQGAATRESIERVANQIAERAGEPLWGEPSDDPDEQEPTPCLEEELVTV